MGGAEAGGDELNVSSRRMITGGAGCGSGSGLSGGHEVSVASSSSGEASGDRDDVGGCGWTC